MQGFKGQQGRVSVETVERLESAVRSYCRSFPVVFDRASGPYLYDVDGRQYIDFFCGAGALNYGHNEPSLKRALIDYLQRDGVAHALDMTTTAKMHFLEELESVVFRPRGLQYRVQFTGPTGTNAVEAALKLARKVTRRANVIAFTGAYHGLSLGSLAVTANTYYRDDAFVQRTNVSFMPYDGYFGPGVDTLTYLRRHLEDDSSGVDLPAAVIVETIQAEGGINVAHKQWLAGLQALCREFGVLLIVDDIQVGCGRTGTFFSFEEAGLEPDLVILSKSISGFGLPMSLLLIRPHLDQWKAGEHTGTFRGNSSAFVTAAAALQFWKTPEFHEHIRESSAFVAARLREFQMRWPTLGLQVRGRGLLHGLETPDAELNREVARECFKRGLIVETCGGRRNVLKLLPPLTIERHVLATGLDIVQQSFDAVAAQRVALSVAE
jgi:diaminobutyrate-2-oxoglutarate transaminase